MGGKNKFRKAQFWGKFYPRDKEKLREVVSGCVVGSRENIMAAIAPHAGYQFSGKLAGEVLSQFPEKETFILLGVNHGGIGKRLSFSREDFETPLGKVKNNGDMTNKLKSTLKEIGSGVNEKAHDLEHSLEVLLPFLQVSQEEKFKIVPLLLKDLDYGDCAKVAEKLAEFVNKDVAVIASSDFTHYGERFGFKPFMDNVKGNLYKLDNKVIEKILAGKPKEVFELANQSTICGSNGLTVLTELARLKEWKSRKVNYYTSGDITGQWMNVVGYGGLVFYS